MIPLFDAHCDTAYEMIGKNCHLRKNDLNNDLERGSIYSPRAQVFAIFNDLSDTDNIAAAAEKQLDYLIDEFKLNSDILALCTNGQQARKAFSEGKTAAFLAVEGAEQLNCDIEKLKWAYTKGVRAVNLTWNHANALSGSNADRADEGLTAAGKDFVRACSELGVIVDVSHISEPGFWDVIETSTKPILAGHSNSWALCPHTRNLTDEQFIAIVENGGVVGINLYSEFLGENADADTVAEHIEHFLSLGGEKNIGIGTDFDGCDNMFPAGIRSIGDLPLIYNKLLQRGLSQKLADDIFFNNMMRIFES